MAEAADPKEYESRLKKALQSMQQMRVRLESLERMNDSLERMNKEPLAIVGMSCRFPGGADNPAAYWDLLRNGVDAISEVPAGRWDADAYYDPDPLAPGKMYTRSGGFLGSIDHFDAEFFGIAPREAVAMDPQQRMLLELSWEALEAAGQPADRLNGSRTGVYIGISTSDYSQFHVNSGETERIDAYSGTGVALSIAAGRVSYVYGFQGPNAAVDTFCSSSLVAIHLACRSLRQRECDMALAGGVNLILSPAGTVYSCKVRALAPDGRCKTFDASADGYGRGEGCGILVLKRLSDAIAAGDNILALIRGTAVNHDGKSSGLTVPNGLSQQAVIRAALDDAGVDGAEVGYVEAHGTGTPLGDPIELRALAAVAASNRPAGDPLIVGSAKTNIGHLEAAAGVAGVIKVALVLGNREIPPHLHFDRPNPHVPWDELRIEVPKTARVWNPAGTRRIAGVSSFGFSGTNAHVILEEAPAVQPRERVSVQTEYLLPVSARTPQALSALIQGYRELVAKNPQISLHDLCYTAGVRRSHHEHRAAFVARSLEDLADRLGAPTMKRANAAETVVFVFGAERTVRCGSDDPAFREMRTRCEAAGAPVLFTSQMAHAALWKKWGIIPQMVLAEGAGEAAGAFAAGIFTFERAIGFAIGGARDAKLNPQGGEIAFESVASGGLDAALGKLDGSVAVLRIGDRKPLAVLAELYAAGILVNWASLYPDGGSLTPLPSYPWQRKRFWLDNVIAIRAPREVAGTADAHPLLGRRILSPALSQVVFEARIGASSPPFLKDHRILGNVLFPAAGFAEIGLVLGRELFGAQAMVSDLTIREPLPLPENHATTLQTVVSKESDGAAEFQIFTLGADGKEWKLHAMGVLGAGGGAAKVDAPDDVEGRLHGDISRAQLYEESRKMGLQYGPAFQGIQRLRWNDREALADVQLPGSGVSEYVLHPALFDSCLQTLGAQLLARPGIAFLPSRIGSLRVLEAPDSRVSCHVSFAANTAPGTWEADLRIFNKDGRLAVEALGILCRQVARESGLAVSRSEFRYTVNWHEKESSFADEQGERALWIVLVDEGDLGNTLCELLRRHDQQCVVVTPGDSYALKDGHAVVDARRPDDFRRLIHEASATTGLPLAGVVHMWALGANHDLLEHVLGSAFHAVQAIGRAKLQEPPRFCIVTRGGQTLDAGNPVSPLQTGLAGLGRIVKVEHPNFHPVTIDLAPGLGGAREARMIYEELLARNPEDLVAFREDVRYVPRLQRENGAVSGAIPIIKADVTYLITGGLGALGLQVAHWLAGKGARHVALMSRSKPSDSVRESLRTLELQGVDVKVLQTDVANAEELRTALAGIGSSAPLRGVIHAAGSVDDGLLVQQTWERFSRVMAAKAAGAWNLHEITKDRPLDFFVLFSSAASLLGSIGQSSYATANAFLDGLAAHRRSLGLPGVSIAWGAWSGAGMAARLSERERVLWVEQGIGALKPEQGLAELETLLAWNAPQIAVLSVDWERFVRLYPTGGELPLLSDLAREARLKGQEEGPSPERVRLLRRLEESSPLERLEILADFVRGQVNEVLGYASSSSRDPNQGFFEIGMDSLMAVDLQRRLQNGLGVTLSSTVGFDHPTIEALVKHLAERAISFQSAAPKAAARLATRQQVETGETSLESMSEDQLLALFSEELEKIGEAEPA